MEEVILIEDFLPQELRIRGAEFPHQWFWDGAEHVDPAKEANAQATRLDNMTTNLANEYARQGKDWETELKQIAKERELLNELGLNGPVVSVSNNQKEDEVARD